MDPDWDSRLLKVGNARVFYGAQWARVLAETYGFSPVYLTVEQGDRLDSLLPIMEVNSRLTGRRGVSLPFTDSCRPFDAGHQLDRLIEEAIRIGKRRRWRYLELRDCDNLVAVAEQARPSVSFLSHILPLTSDIDGLFTRFESGVRRAVRRAETSGMTIDMSTDVQAVSEFYQLHCRTRRKHGLPPQPLKFFLNIHKHILSQGKGMIVSAKYRNRPIASAVFFHLGSEAIYKFGASHPAFQHLRPNNLVIWAAIRDFARKGFASLDFGRTSLSNLGLQRFKLGWAAEERTINYYKYDLRRSVFVGDVDAVSGWHNRIFKILPLFMSRMAGALLYKHIA